MPTIYKYQLDYVGEQPIMVPKGAQFLPTAQLQNDRICVWALVDPDAPKVARKFLIYWTGDETDVHSLYQYLGTVQRNGIVWHVFLATL